MSDLVGNPEDRFSHNEAHIYSSVEVLTTLTTDVGRILSKLHQVQPKGNIRFCTGVKVAHVSMARMFGSCDLSVGQVLKEGFGHDAKDNFVSFP